MKKNVKISLATTSIAFTILFSACTSNDTNSNNTSAVTSNSAVQTGQSASTTQTAVSTNTTNSSEASVTTVSQPTPQAIEGKQLSPSIKQVKVKAVYLSGPSAGSSARVDKIIDIAKNTELNSVVVDIKEDGTVNYESNLDIVKKYGNQIKYYNPEKLIKKFHDNGIYVIGRIVTFNDPVLSKKRADLAIKNSKGSVWLENGKSPWTNPYITEVWDYNIAIAKEAIEKGFDEIQFDYVRFPTGKKGEFNYGTNVPDKATIINGFLAKAEEELHVATGVPVSADVFAIIIESTPDGESIGQRFTEVGKDIYCLNPMIYPSHYSNNAQKGAMSNKVGQKINGVLFTQPDLEPYKVMYNALMAAKTKIATVPDYKAKMRPYLQAFTAKYLPKGYYQTYGPQQIKDQIKAVYDAGYEEWILWDPSNRYQEAYFNK